MEITVGKQPNKGMLEVGIDYYEQVNGLAFQAHLNVWVQESDSVTEIRTRALAAAKLLLGRCLSAHSP